MAKKRAKGRERYGRDAPAKRAAGAMVGITSEGIWKALCADGYRPATECAEVQMCVGVYADLIAAMTIRLMRNTGAGDVREKNALSRRLDIDPNPVMTHTTFFQTIVRAMMETGNQVTLPIYREGLLDRLTPLPPGEVSFVQDGESVEHYWILYRGARYEPDEVLHFPLNPDPARPYMGRGYGAALKDFVRAVRQANATRLKLLESPAPSIIVKVDGLTEEFASPEGRRKLRAQYLDSSDNGEPWFIPAEAFAVEQVRPTSIADLAIKDNLELDKRAIASIFGVPPFMLGVGEYKQDEYQQFLTTRVMAVAKQIEQTLTKGLLWSEELYWSFNPRSLYNYALSDLINAGKEMVDRAAMRRNEWRDWLGLPPDTEMDEIYLLENYLPVNRLGDQKKLNGGEGDE